MISEDIIKAKISTSAQTVEFIQEEDSGSGVNSTQLELIQTLERQSSRIVNLMKDAAALNKEIRTSSAFVHDHVQKNSKQQDEGTDDVEMFT